MASNELNAKLSRIFVKYYQLKRLFWVMSLFLLLIDSSNWQVEAQNLDLSGWRAIDSDSSNDKKQQDVQLVAKTYPHEANNDQDEIKKKLNVEWDDENELGVINSMKHTDVFIEQPRVIEQISSFSMKTKSTASSDKNDTEIFNEKEKTKEKKGISKKDPIDKQKKFTGSSKRLIYHGELDGSKIIKLDDKINFKVDTYNPTRINRNRLVYSSESLTKRLDSNIDDKVLLVSTNTELGANIDKYIDDTNGVIHVNKKFSDQKDRLSSWTPIMKLSSFPIISSSAKSVIANGIDENNLKRSNRSAKSRDELKSKFKLKKNKDLVDLDDRLNDDGLLNKTQITTIISDQWHPVINSYPPTIHKSYDNYYPKTSSAMFVDVNNLDVDRKKQSNKMTENERIATGKNVVQTNDRVSSKLDLPFEMFEPRHQQDEEDNISSHSSLEVQQQTFDSTNRWLPMTSTPQPKQTTNENKTEHKANQTIDNTQKSASDINYIYSSHPVDVPQSTRDSGVSYSPSYFSTYGSSSSPMYSNSMTSQQQTTSDSSNSQVQTIIDSTSGQMPEEVNERVNIEAGDTSNQGFPSTFGSATGSFQALINNLKQQQQSFEPSYYGTASKVSSSNNLIQIQPQQQLAIRQTSQNSAQTTQPAQVVRQEHHYHYLNQEPQTQSQIPSQLPMIQPQQVQRLMPIREIIKEVPVVQRVIVPQQQQIPVPISIPVPMPVQASRTSPSLKADIDFDPYIYTPHSTGSTSKERLLNKLSSTSVRVPALIPGSVRLSLQPSGNTMRGLTRQTGSFVIAPVPKKTTTYLTETQEMPTHTTITQVVKFTPATRTTVYTTDHDLGPPPPARQQSQY